MSSFKRDYDTWSTFTKISFFIILPILICFKIYVRAKHFNKTYNQPVQTSTYR